jgi:hypothetical protein
VSELSSIGRYPTGIQTAAKLVVGRGGKKPYTFYIRSVVAKNSTSRNILKNDT